MRSESSSEKISILKIVIVNNACIRGFYEVTNLILFPFVCIYIMMLRSSIILWRRFLYFITLDIVIPLFVILKLCEIILAG